MTSSPRKLLLIGNCVIDQVWINDAYPHENSEQRVRARRQVVGGNACNSAQILAQLGQRPELVTQMADDGAGHWVRQRLDRLGIGHRYSPVSDHGSTPASCIWLNQANGSRTINHHRDLPELALHDLQSLPVTDFDWLHIEGRNIETMTRFLRQLGRDAGPPRSLELEKARRGIESLLPWFDYAIVSSHYLQQVEQSAESCIHSMSRANPSLQIVVTLGESGLLARDNNGKLIKMEAEPAHQVVDSNGAGDCFIAGLISSLAVGDSFEASLDFARRLAADKIQHEGMMIDRTFRHA